jgi:hypothetical protein
MSGSGSVICTQCGCKRDAHRGIDLLCPPTRGYGMAAPEVRFPFDLEDEQGAAVADAKFAADLRAYWSAGAGTYFAPKDGGGYGYAPSAAEGPIMTPKRRKQLARKLGGRIK